MIIFKKLKKIIKIRNLQKKIDIIDYMYFIISINKNIYKFIDNQKIKNLLYKKIKNQEIYPKCFITNLFIWTINSGVDKRF